MSNPAPPFPTDGRTLMTIATRKRGTSPEDASAYPNGIVRPGLGATRGMGPHGARSLDPGFGAMTPQQVRAMQQFLVNHGFNVAVDGIYGPMTKAAAAAFRANHKGGDAFNKSHGIGVHPTTRPTHPTAPTPTGPAPTTRTTSSAPTSGPNTGSAFDSLLGALLAGGGQVGSMADAGSFGDAAAAPSLAQAAALQKLIAANPKQESQNQFDISSWYGLDPKAKGYQLSVLGRLGLARDRDAAAASAASSNVGDIAKSLVGSIGGSANDGSSSVAAAGTEAAGTMAALGEASKEYANDIAPLLAAEARGAQSKEKAANSQTLLDLENQLATAQGQAKSDRAAAVLGVLGKNNELAQQRFANEGNLLSTLAQMQAVDPNQTGLADAKTLAEIAKIKAQTKSILNPTTKAAAGAKYDLASAGNSVAGLLGVGTDHKLPAGVSVTKLAYTIGSQLQGLGLKKGTPEYQRAGQTLISMFADANGNPIVAPRGWFGPRS